MIAFCNVGYGVWPLVLAVVQSIPDNWLFHSAGFRFRLWTSISRSNHHISAAIFLQTTDYTCGPASAVTALRKLGLSAEEGQIAILSYTSAQEGTPTDMLADGLNRQYAEQGLSAQCRVFHSVAELKQAGLTLAVIKHGFMVIIG